MEKDWTFDKYVDRFLENNYGVTLNDLKKEIAKGCAREKRKGNSLLTVELSINMEIGKIDGDDPTKTKNNQKWSSLLWSTFMYKFSTNFPNHAQFEDDFDQFVDMLGDWLTESYGGE